MANVKIGDGADHTAVAGTEEFEIKIPGPATRRMSVASLLAAASMTSITLFSGMTGTATIGSSSGTNSNWNITGRTLTFAASSGTNNQVLTVTNSSNTAIAAHSIVDIRVGGTTSTGDPQLRWTVPSGTSWYAGIDNSSVDEFIIGHGTAVGTNPIITLAASGLSFTLTGTSQFTGNVYISDISNANMSQGLTINQNGFDNEILAFKSSDVAHGITGMAETDTYSLFLKTGATAGGVDWYGLSSGTVGININGFHTTDNTTKTTAGTGAIILNAALKSGTGVTVCGADANLLVIRNSGTGRFIFDAEGSAHADVEWIAFDRHDDLALIEDMETLLAPDAVKRAFGEVVKYDAEFFARTGLLNDVRPIGGGRMRGMFNTTMAHMVEMGAIRQLGRRQKEEEKFVRSEIAMLKSKLQLLEARNA